MNFTTSWKRPPGPCQLWTVVLLNACRAVSAFLETRLGPRTVLPDMASLALFSEDKEGPA